MNKLEQNKLIDRLFKFYEGDDASLYTRLDGQIMNKNPRLLAKVIEGLATVIIQSNQRQAKQIEVLASAVININKSLVAIQHAIATKSTETKITITDININDFKFDSDTTLPDIISIIEGKEIKPNPSKPSVDPDKIKSEDKKSDINEKTGDKNKTDSSNQGGTKPGTNTPGGNNSGGNKDLNKPKDDDTKGSIDTEAEHIATPSNEVLDLEGKYPGGKYTPPKTQQPPKISDPAPPKPQLIGPDGKPVPQKP